MAGSHAKMATLLPTDKKDEALKTIQVHSFVLRNTFDFPKKLYDAFSKIISPKIDDHKSAIADFETELHRLKSKTVDLTKVKTILKEKASDSLTLKKDIALDVFSLFLNYDFITPEKCYAFLKAYDPDFPPLSYFQVDQKDDLESTEKEYRKNIVTLIKQATQKDHGLTLSLWKLFKNNRRSIFDSVDVSDNDEAYFAALSMQPGQRPPAKRAQSTVLTFSPVV